VTPLERPERFAIEYRGDLLCGWAQSGRDGKGGHGGVGLRVRSVRRDVSKCSKVDMSGVWDQGAMSPVNVISDSDTQRYSKVPSDVSFKSRGSPLTVRTRNC
jgi:hypothetical protein